MKICGKNFRFCNNNIFNFLFILINIIFILFWYENKIKKKFFYLKKKIFNKKCKLNL